MVRCQDRHRRPLPPFNPQPGSYYPPPPAISPHLPTSPRRRQPDPPTPLPKRSPGPPPTPASPPKGSANLKKLIPEPAPRAVLLQSPLSSAAKSARSSSAQPSPAPSRFRRDPAPKYQCHRRRLPPQRHRSRPPTTPPRRMPRFPKSLNAAHTTCADRWPSLLS